MSVRSDVIISIQYVIIICNDVTRICSDEIGQNLLSRHFLASLHVCDTIEGLRLACYELLYKCLYKIDKRLVISIVLHQSWSVYTVKPRFTIYWKEYMRMQSHKKWKDFVWNPVMVVKSVILVKGNMTAS
jgi:hypothetical protein